MERYDAIVVGSGATGGWAAHELTRAGMRVIVLEAGAPLEPLSAEARDARLARQPIQSHVSRVDPSLFVDDIDHPYSTPPDRPYRWLRSRVLGGRTLSWNAILLRFSELDFQPRDGAGEVWPVAYSELAPFYAIAERRLRVSGRHDGLAQLPDGSFLPPRRMTEGERLFATRVERAWPDRRVIIQRGALPGAGWRSTSSTLAAAKRTKRLTVRTDAIVSRLDVSRGRARGVVCVDRITGRTFEVRGDAVVLCASTIETLRILLASEIDSDVLGRYVMDHTMVGAGGTMRTLRRRRLAPYRGGPYGIYLPRFRNVGAPHRAFARGYGVQGVIQRWPVATSTADGVPFQLTAFGEVLADRRNHVTLDPKRRDAWGLPIAKIACSYRDNEEAMVRDQVALFDELGELCGLDFAGATTWSIPGTSIHEVGGARMGTDPRTSVVDRYNRLWAAPNVLVTDGSCFVSAPCQNPTLTMMALTIRACRHLVAPHR